MRLHVPFVGLLATASCLHRVAVPKMSIDAAFTNWADEQQSQAIMQRELNRLAHPDVPLRLVFEGISQRAVIPGSAMTDALHDEAARLHNLDTNQKLSFSLKGAMLPLGVPISESPLSNTQDLEVFVAACEWPVKRVCRSNSASVASAIAATRARRGVGTLRAAKRLKGQPKYTQAQVLGVGGELSLWDSDDS